MTLGAIYILPTTPPLYLRDNLGMTTLERLERSWKRFISLYKPHCENSVDEAMIPFQGRSSLKQYMPAKPVKRGIKVWCRADAHNGYLCQFEVYTGRSEGVQDSLGKRVVLGLSQKLEGLRYHPYFDNFFTSVSLLSSLLDKGLYACGTTRQTYKEFPVALRMKGKSKSGMEPHEQVKAYTAHTNTYVYELAQIADYLMHIHSYL